MFPTPREGLCFFVSPRVMYVYRSVRSDQIRSDRIRSACLVSATLFFFFSSKRLERREKVKKKVKEGRKEIKWARFPQLRITILG